MPKYIAVGFQRMICISIPHKLKLTIRRCADGRVSSSDDGAPFLIRGLSKVAAQLMAQLGQRIEQPLLIVFLFERTFSIFPKGTLYYCSYRVVHKLMKIFVPYMTCFKRLYGEHVDRHSVKSRAAC